MAIDIALDLLYGAVVLAIVWAIKRSVEAHLDDEMRASLASAFKSTVAIVSGMVAIKAVLRIAGVRRR
ncbi:MAG: hypothetical protein ACREXP_25685 [Steroidobacteraceae bacterium]